MTAVAFPCLPAAALEEAAALVNEGDLLVTALSLGFATTALREQPACADTVVDKASWLGQGACVCHCLSCRQGLDSLGSTSSVCS